MKRLDSPEIDAFRDRSEQVFEHFGSHGDAFGGAFYFPNSGIYVIASVGDGWDHVSASLQYRTPTWDEMDAVKRLFFEEWETAVQYHVPPADHVNCHPYCLHLWRPTDVELPRPPMYMVGPQE